jgi:hypothetical protein
VKKVLDRFSMGNLKPVSIPSANHFHLSTLQCLKIVEEIDDMSKVSYASAVWYLTHASICTRPNLAHAVNVVSKYMENLGRQHWDEAKWISRYLKGATKYDITFDKQKSDLSVVRYVNADYAEDLDDRRLTIDYVFNIAEGPIFWRSMIQSTAAMSTFVVGTWQWLRLQRKLCGLQG